MKEWFKARMNWGAALNKLSDEAAGRLMKAIWKFEMTGEEENLTGAECGIFALAVMDLHNDEEKEADISAKRAKAGSQGGQQTAANRAFAIFATQDIANEANADNKNKNKSKNKNIEKEEEQERESTGKTRFAKPTKEEILDFCMDEHLGVNVDKFWDYYESVGWKIGGKSAMKDWRAAVRNWDRRDKSSPQGKKVTAQQYTQRDYSSEDKEALERMLSAMGEGAV